LRPVVFRRGAGTGNWWVRAVAFGGKKRSMTREVGMAEALVDTPIPKRFHSAHGPPQRFRIIENELALEPSQAAVLGITACGTAKDPGFE
jgi:hypothetical protein